MHSFWQKISLSVQSVAVLFKYDVVLFATVRSPTDMPQSFVDAYPYFIPQKGSKVSSIFLKPPSEMRRQLIIKAGVMKSIFIHKKVSSTILGCSNLHPK